MARTTPGKALREAREAADVTLDYAAVYTQIKLGKSLGISREQIRKMEANLVAPRDWNAAALLALADCYGVDPARIMPEEVNKAGLPFLVSAWETYAGQAERPSGWSDVFAGQTAVGQ